MAAKIALLISSLFIAAGLFEGLARAFLPPPPVVQVQSIETPSLPSLELEIHKSINTAPNQLYMSTPAGIRLRPNTHAIVENHETCNCRAEIRTNSLGFRGPELDHSKSKQRILFLGDSITMADYVPEKETWVRRIEQLAIQNGESIEAVNGGIWAIGLSNVLSVLVEPGLKIEPDLVVVGVYLNDAENSPGIKFYPLPQYLQWSRALYYLTRPFRASIESPDYGVVPHEVKLRWMEQAKTYFPPPQGEPKNPTEQFFKAIETHFFDWGAAFSNGAWEHMTPIFEEFQRLSKVHNFKLAFVLFPVADQVYQVEHFDFPQRQMEAIARRLAVPYLDILPALRSAHRGEPIKLFYDWCHYTPEGNAFVAGLIYNFLHSEGLLKSS